MSGLFFYIFRWFTEDVTMPYNGFSTEVYYVICVFAFVKYI